MKSPRDNVSYRFHPEFRPCSPLFCYQGIAGVTTTRKMLKTADATEKRHLFDFKTKIAFIQKK
jgi:hypothetical protein